MFTFKFKFVSGENRAVFEPLPQLSDEEFCALMPDVPAEVAVKVRCLLVDATGWDREEIHPQTRLAEFDY